MKIPPNRPHSWLSLLHPSAQMLNPWRVPITRMLLDEIPLIVHCSFRESMGLYFTLILSRRGGSSSSFATVLIFI
ncbi:hypothetical protein QUB70_10065 [Microcoleus sp. A003_D6]